MQIGKDASTLKPSFGGNGMEYGRLFIADPDEEREDALKQIIADLLVELCPLNSG